jgi:hypothetical protein
VVGGGFGDSRSDEVGKLLTVRIRVAMERKVCLVRSWHGEKPGAPPAWDDECGCHRSVGRPPAAPHRDERSHHGVAQLACVAGAREG